VNFATIFQSFATSARMKGSSLIRDNKVTI